MPIISYDSKIYKIYTKVLGSISGLNCNKLKQKFSSSKKYYDLTDVDLGAVRDILATNYCIISTRRKTVLSTYLIGFASWVKTGNAGHYDHVLLNLEDDNPVDDNHFQLYEATAKGTQIATFMEVFDCDSVVLLRPKNISISEWHGVIENVKKQIGKPYDDLFDLNDNSRLSCVELTRDALRTIPDYNKKFPNLEASISKYKNLTPQMFYDSGDFEIVFEVRR